MDNLLKKEQIYKELKRRLQTGEISPGSKLKSGLELAKEFNVSHMTIRGVLRELSLEGLLRVVHGKGIFSPNEPVHKTPNLLVLRLGATLEHPGHYIMPTFISRTHELGGKVTEINVQFIRNNPSESMVAELRNAGYTGILLDGSSYLGNEPELKVVKQLGLPTIISSGNFEDVTTTKLPVLGCNIKQAWKDGLKAICQTGRKRIALLLCTSGNKNLYRDRTLDEHLQLLKTCGLEDNPQLIKVCPNVFDSNCDSIISNAIDELLCLDNKPEAIYCFSDFVALKVYTKLKEKKLRIPDDVAVMGFCGFPGGSLQNPPLATVDEDYATFGKIAAEKLCAPELWFNKSSFNTWNEIPYKILTRASIGKKSNSQ